MNGETTDPGVGEGCGCPPGEPCDVEADYATLAGEPDAGGVEALARVVEQRMSLGTSGRWILDFGVDPIGLAADLAVVLDGVRRKAAADALTDAADAALNEPESVLPEIRPVARWLRDRAAHIARESR